MRFHHFFWDFDGTLFNTYGRITRAAQKALRDNGLDVDFDTVYAACKHSLDTAWNTLGVPNGISAEACAAAYRRHAEEEGVASFLPYPDMPETLRMLYTAGGSHYLYTHRGASGAECLQYNGLWELFSDEVNSSHGFPRKPAPDALLYLIDKHHLQKEDCVMIGDRPLDVEAAKNAGMSGILFDPENFYSDYTAQMRVYSMKEIPVLVQA